MAFETVEKKGKDVWIQCVGMNYSDSDKFRSKAIANRGRPFKIDAGTL
jgi:hypothetical protein